MDGRTLLKGLGSRLRRVREEKRWSRRETAERAGLSERFLAQVESGEGNLSILSLARLAGALGTAPAALLEGASRTSLVALLGLRGAGKSTVGRELAARRGVPFVELDHRVEESAGLSLAEIFELHGEESYRRWEREALDTVLSEGAAVVATGGGIVAHAETYDLLRRHAVTVWLKATPQEHWDRVVAQGDHRPMANDPLARDNLRDLLARREPLYRTADHIVDTSGLTEAQVVSKILALI
ncbi:MAG TPA: shikimate kinase [Candidatus Polarisedimenticolia bacterium]|nr:shikimate kinase [Candidatus Polarisedimenticolia bacterium]